MGLPSKNIVLLLCVHVLIAILHRFKFLILSLAIATATFSFYVEESRAHAEHNLSAGSEVRKSLINKKRKKHRKSKFGLEAIPFEQLTVRKRSNVNLQIGFLSESVIKFPDNSFKDRGVFISDEGPPRSSDGIKPILPRSPPFLS
ncbi:MAG TPA: hypothetical protein VHT73_14640 [Thermodesulfobacteriota bacterium]|nr:hypothetical protein [Thermodesulfobacteriota bacterium]